MLRSCRCEDVRQSVPEGLGVKRRGLGKGLQIGQRSTSLVCFRALQSRLASILLHKGYGCPAENKQGRCLLPQVTFLKLPLTKRPLARQQTVSTRISIMLQNQGGTEGASPRRLHSSLFSIMRSSREIRSRSGFGVGRKSKSLPSSSQQTGLPWLPGGTNAHQRSSASTFLHLALFFSPFLPSPPSPVRLGCRWGAGEGGVRRPRPACGLRCCGFRFA